MQCTVACNLKENVKRNYVWMRTMYDACERWTWKFKIKRMSVIVCDSINSAVLPRMEILASVNVSECGCMKLNGMWPFVFRQWCRRLGASLRCPVVCYWTIEVESDTHLVHVCPVCLCVGVAGGWAWSSTVKCESTSGCTWGVGGGGGGCGGRGGGRCRGGGACGGGGGCPGGGGGRRQC